MFTQVFSLGMALQQGASVYAKSGLPQASRILQNITAFMVSECEGLAEQAARDNQDHLAYLLKLTERETDRTRTQGRLATTQSRSAEPLSRQQSQFVIDNRQQFCSSRRITVLNLAQYLCDVGHGCIAKAWF